MENKLDAIYMAMIAGVYEPRYTFKMPSEKWLFNCNIAEILWEIECAICQTLRSVQLVMTFSKRNKKTFFGDTCDEVVHLRSN